MNKQKPAPVPQLTDAECDAIERHARLDIMAVDRVDWLIYRRSQYATLAEAEAVRATACGRDVFGYTAALDTFEAMASTADLLNHRADEDDVRIIITIDDARLPECWLADASTEIHRHLIRTGNYTVTQ